jgi:2-iminobutanoate/2-iminopropanoate deaminase
MQFHMITGGPGPVAPFSHAVETDGFVFITGQMPDTPDAPGVLPEGIVAQTHAVIANLRTVLAGLSLNLEHARYGAHLSDPIQGRLRGDERRLSQLLP